MAKVSVIIPVYNAEKTLERCLDALINQTFSDFEVICVNDGSKDNSWEVLEKYSNKDSRIKAFNLENHGVAYTRNFAISKMSGKYLMFCDADDWYEPSMIEEMVNTIEERNVDVVMCDANVIDIANGEIQKEGDKKYVGINLLGDYNLNTEIVEKINVVLWNKIFKKELIDKYKINYPNKYEHDDMGFVCMYLAIAKTYLGLNKKLYNYIVGNEKSIMGKNLTSTNYGKEFDFIYAFKIVFDFIQKLEKPEYDYFIKKRFRGYFLHYIQFLNNKQQKEALSIIQKYILESGYFKDNNPKEIEYIKEAKNVKRCKELLKYGKLNPLEKIFSVKNNGNKKVIRLFGLKLKIKRKQFCKSTKIFITYHKPYALFRNDICTPINAGRYNVNDVNNHYLTEEEKQWMKKNTIGDDSGENISELNKFLSEYTTIYWLWKNYEKIGNPDTIGFMHYRTLFMLHSYPQYDDNYLDSCGYKEDYICYLMYIYRAITGGWVRNIKSQYECYKGVPGGHNIIFYDALLDIFKTKFKKDYKSFYKWSMTPNKGGPFKNMFIMRKEDFFKLCEWIFPILFELLDKFKNYAYQDGSEKRNFAWLSELLTAYWIDKNIGQKNCHETSTFRPIAESRELVEV